MTPKELAIKLVTQAGQILRENIGTVTPEKIETKSPFDYVTKIDNQCEELIITSLQHYFPGHDILAEESGKINQSNNYCWIIDPLDGTTNFIHGIPHSAISIALQKDDEIILGVTYDPFHDELFWAEKGKGAFCNNQAIRVSNQARLNRCLIATGFPFRNRDLLDRYCQVLMDIFVHVSGIRRMGSATLDLAYVACGRYEGFWEQKLSPWDVAAGIILIREAGGEITDFEGNDNPLRSGNVIASNHLIHDFILHKVQAVFPSNP